MARLLAERLSAELPQRVVVENRAGGGAMIGTEAVAHAPKDGSVLLFTTVVHAVHRALQGGRISLLMDSVATGAGPVRAGILRGLATTGAARSPALPDVPTVQETMPGFVATTWNAILAPAGTPPATVAGLSAAVGRALADPALAARLAGLGVDVPPPEGRTPEATANFISAETTKWTRVIETVGIKAACAEGPPLPVLFVSGDGDPTFPWAGFANAWGRMLSRPESQAVFARRNGCGAVGPRI